MSYARFRTIEVRPKDPPTTCDKLQTAVDWLCRLASFGAWAASRRGDSMRDFNRRGVIGLIGGAAASWPLAARAQQGGRARRVGLLHAQSSNDLERQASVAVFRQALGQLGWTE